MSSGVSKRTRKVSLDFPYRFAASPRRHPGLWPPAEQSLAETEQRLTLETEHFKLALELAEDVAPVYAEAADSTKRSLNQAFFTKLFVLPEWDEQQGQTSVRIAGAELTEPYALLLADDLVPGVLAEVEAITAAATRRNAEEAPESQMGAPKALAAGCSYFDVMAGLEGPLSKHDPVWQRIRELHAQRFGNPCSAMPHDGAEA